MLWNFDKEYFLIQFFKCPVQNHQNHCTYEWELKYGKMMWHTFAVHWKQCLKFLDFQLQENVGRFIIVNKIGYGFNWQVEFFHSHYIVNCCQVVLCFLKRYLMPAQKVARHFEYLDWTSWAGALWGKQYHITYKRFSSTLIARVQIWMPVTFTLKMTIERCQIVNGNKENVMNLNAILKDDFVGCFEK